MAAQGRRIREDDPRLTRPLYTIDDAALYLGESTSTIRRWARGFANRPPNKKRVVGQPVITCLDRTAREPRIPFIGIAEGFVVAVLRHAGVSLQHIRRAIDILRDEIELDHALASKRLYTDGAKVLYDYAERGERELSRLTVVVSKQGVLGDLVERYLERISYDRSGWPTRLRLPITQRAVLELDPARAFGQAIFLESGARMKDVLDRFLAGDSIDDVALDYGVKPSDVEEVVRAVAKRAA